MWQGETVGRSSVHARRRIAAMALAHACSARRSSSALDRRGGGARPAERAGPERRRRRGHGQAVRLRRRRSAPTTRRGAALGLSHVLYAKSPGGVVASAAAHRALAPDRSTASPRATARPRHARGDRLARSRPGAPTRAPSDDLRSAVGPDPDPGRDRPEPARHADRRQGLRAPDARHPARPPACAGARRCAGASTSASIRPRRSRRPARYLDFAKGKLGRDDLAVVSYHMGVGNLQQALTALRPGHRPLRPALLRLEPAAPRGGVAQARLAGRRLLDLPVAGARRARDHAPVPQATPRRSQREAVLQSHKASAEEVLHPRRAHDGVRRPLRDRPRAGVRRRCARSTRRSSRPTGCGSTRSMGELARRIKQSPRLYRALRPQALAMLEAIGAATQAIARTAAAGRSRARCATRTTSASWPRPTARRPPPTRCTRPATPSTSPRLPQPRAGARLPVRPRPPHGAGPDRLGARARGDPRDGRVAVSGG